MTETHLTAAELERLIAAERAAWQAAAENNRLLMEKARKVTDRLRAARPRDPAAMAQLLRWLAAEDGGCAAGMLDEDLHPILEHIADQLDAMAQRP
jgi:hypothetical protein